MSEENSVIYISGPMTGYDKFNLPAFVKAEKQLIDAGYTVINPASFGEGLGLSYEDLLREDLIQMLTKCNAVATLPGWQKSKGAYLEVSIAVVLQMPIKGVSEWVASNVRVW